MVLNCDKRYCRHPNPHPGGSALVAACSQHHPNSDLACVRMSMYVGKIANSFSQNRYKREWTQSTAGVERPTMAYGPKKWVQGLD